MHRLSYGWRGSHQDGALYRRAVRLKPIVLMTASAFRALSALVLVVTQACYVPIGHGAKPEIASKPVRSNGAPKSRRNGNGFGPKSVQGKEKPTRLVARDGTSCIVSRKKFESTNLGTSVWCAWMDLR
jgi:hypothetical protein